MKAIPLHITAVAIIAAIGLASIACAYDTQTYPGEMWIQLASPAELGWDIAKLDDAKAFAATLDTEAVMVVQHGVVVSAWGNYDRKYMCHSMRKAMLSALYGPYVESGKIKLTSTLADLGIDDKELLTDAEKQATVADLLSARSGVYHPAAYEPDSMKENRPARESHAHGTFWFYNNWDFNTLVTIFEQSTGEKIWNDFDQRIATPIGMEDFKESDGRYLFEEQSIHPAYLIIMSARDLARFGLLMARGGRWKGKQVVPEAWVRESTATYSDAGDLGGYGYMWWTTGPDNAKLWGVDVDEGSFALAGSNGHFVLIMPESDIVIVHRVNTTLGNREVTYQNLSALLQKVLAAHD